MPNMLSSFDFLFLTEKLSGKFGTATFGEIHLFSYLGCLLSLFGGQPVADWGYGFAGLDTGAPFSAELQGAYQELESAGFVANSGGKVVITEQGKYQLEFLSTLRLFDPRKIYLAAGCESLLCFPVGMVRNAMSMEPGLRPVLKVGGARPLLETTALEQLHEHFDALYGVLGQPHDLLAPSTVWLSYLLELSRKYDQDLALRAQA